MKIILKYILTNVKERKTRTIVMLLSIVLSAVLLFVSFSIGTSYENAQQKMARGMAGSAAISVSPLSPDDTVGLDDIPELTSIKAKAGMLEGSALYHEDGYYETIDLIASDLSLLNQINKPRLVSGGDIENFTGYKVILPDRFTSKYGIEKGDTVILQINGVPTRFEVAEIASYDTVFLRHTRGATALLPESTLAEILQKKNGYSEILIEPAGDVSAGELADTLTEELSGRPLSVSKVVNEEQIEADARQKSMPFFLISFFALTMSVFIIYSSYKVITLDRLPIIGTFRSIGATQKTVTRILMLESALYGFTGGIIGILLGTVILKLILRGMGDSLSAGIEIPVVITPAAVLLSFGTAVIVSILSAWIPVRRASRLPIKDVVLGMVEEKHMPNHHAAGIGIALLVVSVLLPRLASGKFLYPAGGFSLLGLISAAIMVIPLVTNLLSKVLERVYTVIFKNEGMLAARNLRDNKNITQNITLLFISISAVIAITVVGNFVNTYITDVFNGAELQGFADGEMDEDFIRQVEGMEGIEKILPVYVFNNEMQCQDHTFSRLEATDNLELYNSMFHLIYSKKDMEVSAISAFSETRSILLNEDVLNRNDYEIGDSLTLENDSGRNTYTIAGSFKSRATDVEAVIPSAYAIPDFKPAVYHFLAYTAADPDSIMIQIRDLFGNTQNWSRTVEEFNTDALSTVGVFLEPMFSMTYLILLLAAVGIINNLLINYIQKRRSIAMYKSVGLSNRQNIKITIIESLTSGIIGAAIAIVVSYLEIQTIFLVAGPKISMSPDLDFKTFLSAGLLGILVTLAGSVVPMVKSRKMKLVEEIKFE
ncbi:FtsX-like permease family protein [Faecalicatena orotica]|uniref:ABC-type lipoprotein release transport system permease subunit n=1 Tax=Faecalicatena orotica TaxID=1544 RepID=A0A2Y9BM03_9FIRM|nr:FtsX-like permease family protein [Faecalicatena orotica]PWJ21456.1 ABC-type lipoprotein release transport system permease subunit [Faecalicatena orotica]SSA58431.1 ABC-type transport system, involved in lipoprotein release, permease component [Faecalicatena orotica]